MSYLVVALILLTLTAVVVTVTDAFRAAHRRVVAVERRRSWQERTEGPSTARTNGTVVG